MKMKSTPELSVSLWKVRLFGWASLVFFTVCFVGAFASDQWIVSLFFIPFVMLSIAPLLYSGTIHLNSKTISLSAPLGHYVIEWAEIERIELGQSQIGFVGGVKRLSIPTPQWWAGRDRADLQHAILRFLDQRGMEFQRSFLADFRFSSHTKLRNANDRVD